MGLMVASAPLPVLKGMWEYRWMGSYLGTFAFIDRLFEGYRGPSLKIAHLHMHAIVQSLTKKIAPRPRERPPSRRRPAYGQDGAHGRGAPAALHDRLPEPHPDTAPDPCPSSSSATSTSSSSPSTSTWPRASASPPDVCSRCRGGDGRHLQRRLPAHRQGLPLHQHALQRQRGYEHVPAPPH